MDEWATRGALGTTRHPLRGRPATPQPRILLVTGKGGTGKTTMAAATALAAPPTAVREPWWCPRTLRTPSAMRSGARSGAIRHRSRATLSAQEIDAQQLFDRSWSTVRTYLQDLLEWAGADSVRAEELAVVPGLDELLAPAHHRRARGWASWDAVDRRLRPDRRDRSSPGPPLDAADVPRPCAPRPSAARPLGGARPASGHVDAPGARGRPRQPCSS